MLMTRALTADRGSTPVVRATTPWPPGITFAAAAVACAPTALVAWLAGAGAHPLAGLMLFGAVAAGFAAVSCPLGATGATLLLWATDDGFVIDRFGVLTLDPRSVSALAAMALAVLGAYAGGAIVRRLRSSAGHGRVEPSLRVRSGIPCRPR